MTAEHVTDHDSTEYDRRGALRAGALIGIGGAAVGAVAACGSGAGSGDSGGSSGSGGAKQAPSKGTALAKTADVPVGGGSVLAGQHVVVTQPSAGVFKCFSSTCTHQGCTVNSVAGGVIKCPCHGSQFSATDGSVRQGPAPSPLPSVPITVSNGQIFSA